MNIQSKPINVNWKRILIIGVIVAIAGYQWYTEANKGDGQVENQQGATAKVDNAKVDDGRYDARLPDVSKTDRQQAVSKPSGSQQLKPPQANRPAETKPANGSKSNGQQQKEPTSRDEYLKRIRGNDWQSPSGLIFTMGPGGEHRVDHVMRHGRDDQSRPAHGVFEGDEVTILKLLDEVHELIKSKSKYVKSEESRGNTAYTVSTGRKIGYEGGEKGKRSGNRPLKSVRLILDGKRVITAYPYR